MHTSAYRPFRNTVNIAGFDLITFGRDELADLMVTDCKRLRDASPREPTRLVFDMNGHGLSLAQSDLSYRDAIHAADIVHADGGFLVTLSRFCGTKITDRTVTTDVFHDFALRAASEGLTFFLLGGTEEVNAACAEKMVELYPGLQIVGRRNGYYSAESEAHLVETINKSRPDVLWVGLGKPREQLFGIRNRDILNAGWLVTCGGCFNYVTGHYPRAPMWMQRANLEWLFRMMTSPRQLFWRYLVTTPHALFIALTRTNFSARRNRQSKIE